MDHPTQIPIGHITAGRNPRKYFDPVRMTEFEASIRVQGLLQPILLRPKGRDAYEIVAGERRYRAFRSVHGDAASIPAFVREMTDSEADAAALAENVDRESMTSVEEAEAAARILGEHQGNRDEAAARLGWSRTKLDKRLALMYATDKVRDALQAGKILLGHAELLAVCRKEAQDAALDILLRQEKVMSVADFKAHIDRASLVLDTAIFDKTECSGCIHNSGNQSALFAEVISGGRCSNKECFDRKTEAELVVRETALKDDFQVVRIVRPGENLTLVPLQSEGPKGVGPDQAKACQVCKNFGAVVSAVPDKLGHVYKNMCMDVACNVRMVAAKVKKEAASSADAPRHADGHSKEQSATHTKPPVDGSGKATEPSKKTKPPVTYPEPSARIKEYREKLWRAIFQRVVTKLDVADNRALLVAYFGRCWTLISVSLGQRERREMDTQFDTRGHAQCAASRR